MLMNNSISMVENKDNQYKCGCKLQFKDKASFKEHSLFVHNGEIQNGSSHFLTKFTFIVLPLSEESHKSNNKKIREQLQKIPHKTQTIKLRRSYVNSQVKKQQVTQEVTTLKQIKKVKREVKSIEWNGFRLAVNKAYRAQGYYCGNCSINFIEPQPFIIHCIQVCQELKNKNSSHCIGSIYDEEKIREFPMENKAQNEEMLPTKPKRGRVGRPKALQSNSDPIFQILLKKLDHKNIPFKCAVCDLTLSNALKYYHHMNVHSQMIDPRSSHIILRIEKSQGFLNSYISASVEWINQDEKYYCSCKSDKKMPMTKLIRHVSQVHKGISPIYRKRQVQF